MGVHSWATAEGLLEGSTDIWDVSIEGANCHERFAIQCQAALEAFSTMYPSREGVFVYDNGRYAKKKPLAVSKARKAELVEWAANNGLDSSGTVKELKTRIKESLVYKEQTTLIQQLFSENGHQLVYLPPCHPEYNMMELIWAKVKRHCQEYCDYTKRGMWTALQEGMRGIDGAGCERMA